MQDMHLLLSKPEHLPGLTGPFASITAPFAPLGPLSTHCKPSHPLPPHPSLFSHHHKRLSPHFRPLSPCPRPYHLLPPHPRPYHLVPGNPQPIASPLNPCHFVLGPITLSPYHLIPAHPRPSHLVPGHRQRTISCHHAQVTARQGATAAAPAFNEMHGTERMKSDSSGISA